jgi:hypothetical protein
VEHEKKTFFSLLKNSRSEDGGQGRAHFARRVAGLPLDGHRSGGYAAKRARDACSNTDPLLSTRLRPSNLGYFPQEPRTGHFSLSCLIPLALTPVITETPVFMRPRAASPSFR